MAFVQKAADLNPAVKKDDRTFIGRGWLNKTKDGKVYTNIKIDRGMVAQVDENCTIQLWENKKREGKRDADFRVSILIPVAQA